MRFISINLYISLCFFTSLCFAQSFSDNNSDFSKNFFYSLQYKADSMSSNNQEEIFILDVGNEKSLFASLNNLKKDSMMKNIKSNYENLGGNVNFSGVPKTKFSYYVSKNISEKKILTYQNLASLNFVYEEDLQSNWTLFNEKKK